MPLQLWAGDPTQCRKCLSTKSSLVPSWQWCVTPRQPKMAFSTKKEEEKKKKNNRVITLAPAPVLSLLLLLRTSSAYSCVGDISTKVPFLPDPCYKIICFMLHFHRSLVMFSHASHHEAWEVYGAAKKSFSLLVSSGLASKSNKDKVPQILPWREYFQRSALNT